MRKFLLFLTICLLSIITSCKKHKVPTQNYTYNKITAIINDLSDTRVNIDGASVTWEEGDYFNVYRISESGIFTDATKYTIDHSSISSDGKEADFKGEKLTIGEKYLAVSGSSSIITEGENKGQISVSTCSDFNSVDNNWFTTSTIFTVNEIGDIVTHFTNRQSILKLNLRLQPDVKGDFKINKIEFTSEASAFSNNLTVNTLGEIYTDTTQNSITTLLLDSQEITLNSKSDYSLKLPIWVDTNISDISGDFKIKIYTNDKKEAEISTPAQNLKNGNYYSLDLAFFEPLIPEISDYESTDYSKDREVTKLWSATSGQNLDGMNFVLIGDGFTDKDIENGTYDRIMNSAKSSILNIEPLTTYKDYVNIYSITAVSKNKGIGTEKETALSTGLKSSSIVYGNDNMVFDYASEISSINLSSTVIIVIPNSSQYGGTCYNYTDGRSITYCPYAYNSDDEFAKIIHHEAIGHGLGRLLDEYIYYGTPITDKYIQQYNNDAQTFNMGGNISLDKDNVSWQHFIGLENYEEVDIFEGGYFFQYGVWRPEMASCMSDNRPYFNAPSRERLVRTIMDYTGEAYSFENFLANDIKTQSTHSTAYNPLYKSSSKFIPLHPPIMVSE